MGDQFRPVVRTLDVIVDGRPQHRLDVLLAIRKSRIRTDRDALHALGAGLGNEERRLT
ncbi:uncharacterized protein METZ01_LOCUS53573, partial [marine metagenome]